MGSTPESLPRRGPRRLSWQRKFLLYVLVMQASALLILRSKAPLFHSARFSAANELPPLNHFLHKRLVGSLVSVSGAELAVQEGPFVGSPLSASGAELALQEEGPYWIPKSDVVTRLEAVNQRQPRNEARFSHVSLTSDSIVLVLYVHNRPEYLRLVVKALSHVEGLNETLLIVSHDGFFEEMNAIVEGITFCRVKQIFAPLSPHLHPNTFPGRSPDDCEGKEVDVGNKSCRGEPDHYGNYRKPHVVSLKHHWWWMMNTVWDSLAEIRNFQGHIAFIEEDHFLFPNAYRTLQALVRVKREQCPMCWAVMLAPFDVKSPGELRWNRLLLETMGNIGYTFNRTVWERIKAYADGFCRFDDYNWDVSLRTVVFEEVEDKFLALRSPTRSAAHFGRCGLHEGKAKADCQKILATTVPPLRPADFHVNFNDSWPLYKKAPRRFRRDDSFLGWGGWGDKRDQRLCLHFAGIEVDENLEAYVPGPLQAQEKKRL